MRLVTLLILAALPALQSPAAAQRNPASNDEGKEQFLYSFLQFVRWPADAFQSPSEPLRLQIIGRDPFDGSLDRFLAGKTANGRRIVVTHAGAPTTTPFPHVLFVSAAEEPRLATVLAAYCGAPVLTISDLDRFANRGGVIGLIEKDHVLRFTVNRTAAGEARVDPGSQLLYLAVPLLSAISPCGLR
jgi:hypothetical protein